MVGGWLIVLASSSTLYGKMQRLILKKTSRLTQAVVFFRRHFMCGALLCNCSPAEGEGLSTHVQRECSAEPFIHNILSLRSFTSRPASRLRFFIAMRIQYSCYESLERLIGISHKYWNHGKINGGQKRHHPFRHPKWRYPYQKGLSTPDPPPSDHSSSSPLLLFYTQQKQLS